MTLFTPPMIDATATRDASMTWLQFMGISTDGSEGTYRGLSDYAKAPADEAWVYSCVRRIQSSAVQIPLVVYHVQGKDLIPWSDAEGVDTSGSDLQYVLDNVNPVDMNGADLKGFTAAGIAVWGETHWRKVRGRLGGAPQELYWLRAPDIRPHSPDGRAIDYFDYTPQQAQPSQIKWRDMVLFKTVNLDDPLHGLSALSATRNDISVSRQATIQTASVLANWGVPPGAWVQSPNQPTLTTQEQGIIRRALRALRGPRNQGKVPILPGGLDWKAMALNPKDAEWLAARKVSRMSICAAFGVPLVLAGDDEKTSVYANLRDAERIFWRGTMIPFLDHVADVINGWLVPDFDRTKDPRARVIKVAWDYSGIEALLIPLNEASAVWNSWVDRNAVTRNEMRRHFRLGKDLPWGDHEFDLTRVNIRDTTTAPVIGVDEGTGQAAPTPEPAITEPSEEDNSVEDTLRSFGSGLYRVPAIRAFAKGAPLDELALFGRTLDTTTHTKLETGLRRRYSAEQLIRYLRGDPE
jgi:HK97 family phage portal protein